MSVSMTCPVLGMDITMVVLDVFQGRDSILHILHQLLPDEWSQPWML